MSPVKNTSLRHPIYQFPFPPAGGNVMPLLAHHNPPKVAQGTQWSHSEPESQKGRLFKDQRVYHEEYSGHRHHKPAEFVWEGLERLRLPGDGVDSFHPGVLGFKLRPQLLLINNTHYSQCNSFHFFFFIIVQSVSNVKDVLHELKLWGHLFEDMAELPLPPPSRWDPSHKSVLPSVFSRTPETQWLQTGSGYTHIIVWYVTDRVINMNETAVGRSLWTRCRTNTRYPEWNTGCSDVHRPLKKLITAISSQTA